MEANIHFFLKGKEVALPLNCVSVANLASSFSHDQERAINCTALTFASKTHKTNRVSHPVCVTQPIKQRYPEQLKTVNSLTPQSLQAMSFFCHKCHLEPTASQSFSEN